MILAWESKQARTKALEEHGFKAKSYKDRPIAKWYWSKQRDHPIHGLGHYEIEEPKDHPGDGDQSSPQ